MNKNSDILHDNSLIMLKNMTVCSLQNILICKNEEDSSLNFLWNLILSKQDTIQDIFNNKNEVLKLSRQKICDYLNEPYEDKVGENILQYIIDQRPKEILDFLNSSTIIQAANIEGCIYSIFMFNNDENKTAFDIALTDSSSFNSLLKSSPFILSLNEQKKYDIFANEIIKRVTLVDKIHNLSNSNDEYLKIFLNDQSIYGLNIKYKKEIFSKLKYTSDFIGIKERYDMSTVEKIINSDFYKMMSCKDQKDLLEYEVQGSFCDLNQKECEKYLSEDCLNSEYIDNVE